jgi:serine/threonine protein kinase
MATLPQRYATQPQFKPLRQLGPYQLDAVLGIGATAAVYRARRGDGQMLALKVLHQEAMNDAPVRQAFQREARLLLRLRHPGIITALDSGQFDGRFYLALALVDGPTLDEFLGQTKKVGEQVTIDVGVQVAAALHYLHEQNIVHRDIKPANILLQNQRRAILFDFGAALDRNTEQAIPGEVFGTPAFLAPEQARGDAQIDGRADIYGLGVTLYRMVTGRKPFYGSRLEVLEAQVLTPPPRPSSFGYVSPELEAAILRALAKDPAERFQSGAEMAAALEAARSAEPPPELPRRLLGWLRGG